MRRAKDDPLDLLLEQWARWLADDHTELGMGCSSFLARWMDCKGDMVWGASSVVQGPQDSIERRVELVVYELAKRDQLLVDVLRLEYSARWQEVATRRGLKNYKPHGKTQLDHALALGVSLRTYKGRLAKARAEITTRLGMTL